MRRDLLGVLAQLILFLEVQLLPSAVSIRTAYTVSRPSVRPWNLHSHNSNNRASKYGSHSSAVKWPKACCSGKSLPKPTVQAKPNRVRASEKLALFHPATDCNRIGWWVTHLSLQGWPFAQRGRRWSRSTSIWNIAALSWARWAACRRPRLCILTSFIVPLLWQTPPRCPASTRAEAISGRLYSSEVNLGGIIIIQFVIHDPQEMEGMRILSCNESHYGSLRTTRPKRHDHLEKVTMIIQRIWSQHR